MHLRFPVPLQLAQVDHLFCSLIEWSVGWQVSLQPWQSTFPVPWHLEHVSSAIFISLLVALLVSSALLVTNFNLG